jgi:hypothetical protein
MSPAFRIAHGTMAALFALSVLLQFNDPSPLAWIVLYALAASAALLAAIKHFRYAQILGLIVLVIGLISEIPYVRAKAWETPMGDLTKEWHMTSEAIVDGREFYALLWIVVWMVVVVLTSRRASKSAASAP